MLGALNADSLPCEYYYRLFGCLESVQRITGAEQNFELLSKENGISREFDSEIYIPSSTIVTFVAMK